MTSNKKPSNTPPLALLVPVWFAVQAVGIKPVPGAKGGVEVIVRKTKSALGAGQDGAFKAAGN